MLRQLSDAWTTEDQRRAVLEGWCLAWHAGLDAYDIERVSVPSEWENDTGWKLPYDDDHTPFDSDDGAEECVLRRALAGSSLHMRAVYLYGQKLPTNGEKIWVPDLLYEPPDDCRTELAITVPTYSNDGFTDPKVPVLVYQAEGLRVVLGSHDVHDCEKPDIQIERRPGGWAIFLHPKRGQDASGYVYLLDDGRTFVQPERGSPDPIEMLERSARVPGIDS